MVLYLFIDACALLSDVGVDDMTLLAKVRNEDISENLSKRFLAGFMYTYIGHVLVRNDISRDNKKKTRNEAIVNY